MDNKKSDKPKPLKLSHPPPPKPRVRKVDIDRVLQAHTDSVLRSTGLVVYHNGTDVQQARGLVLKFGVEKAVELATAYPTIQDDWLHNKGYPLSMLDRNVNAVEVKLQGLGKRKRRDPLDIVTDPNDPVWDEEL